MIQIAEILGAVNFWISPTGKAHSVSGHASWACQHILNCKIPQSLENEPIYQAAKSKGWVRVAILPAQSEMRVDYKSLNRSQLTWIEDTAITRKLAVISDDGETLMDYTTEYVEALAACAVAQLLS